MKKKPRNHSLWPSTGHLGISKTCYQLIPFSPRLDTSQKVEIKDTTESESFVSYLYILLEKDSNGNLTTKFMIQISLPSNSLYYVPLYLHHMQMELLSLSWFNQEGSALLMNNFINEANYRLTSW